MTIHDQATTHGTTPESEGSQQQPQQQHRDEESAPNPHTRLTYMCTDCRPPVCLDVFALVSPGARHTHVLRPQQAPPSPSPCKTPMGGVFAGAPLELLPLVTAVPGAEEDGGQEQDSVMFPVLAHTWPPRGMLQWRRAQCSGFVQVPALDLPHDPDCHVN